MQLAAQLLGRLSEAANWAAKHGGEPSIMQLSVASSPMAQGSAVQLSLKWVLDVAGFRCLEVWGLRFGAPIGSGAEGGALAGVAFAL